MMREMQDGEWRCMMVRELQDGEDWWVGGGGEENSIQGRQARD